MMSVGQSLLKDFIDPFGEPNALRPSVPLFTRSRKINGRTKRTTIALPWPIIEIIANWGEISESVTWMYFTGIDEY